LQSPEILLSFFVVACGAHGRIFNHREKRYKSYPKKLLNDDPLSPLCWDATYEIVLALTRHYPQIKPETVGLEQLCQLILALPGFEDDSGLAHEGLLNDILREWYEESEVLNEQ